MTDDLVKRLDALVEDLGEGRACWGHEYISAAVDAMERIEELEAKLAKAVEALEHAKLNMPHPDQMIDDALAELTGGQKDGDG